MIEQQRQAMSAQMGVSTKAAEVQDIEKICKFQEEACGPCSMHRFKAHLALHE